MPSQAIYSQLLLGLYSCVSMLYSTYLILGPPQPWALGARPSRLCPEPGLDVIPRGAQPLLQPPVRDDTAIQPFLDIPGHLISGERQAVWEAAML